MPNCEIPITYGSLDHVVLRCRDLPAMLNFYENVLGCVPERVTGDLHQLRAGRSLIDLIPGREHPADNVDHYCLSIHNPDWQALRSYLAKHGVKAEEPRPRYGADGTGLSVYLKDPEGNVVELKGPPEPGT